MENMIEVKDLRKEFKSHSSRSGLMGAFRDLLTRNYQIIPAVNDISFNVKKGEMVGYIGENGAGKSTSIKMLTGILTPTSGIVRVNGMNPHKEREAFVRSIGVVFGQRSQLWWDIAVQESFRLLKKVYNVPDHVYNEHMNHVIESLDIGPLLDKPVRKLSLGQRMRCELAAALLHNPSMLFLDEPTIGLDVLVKLKIRNFLKEMNEKYQTTVLLTTHDLSDIEALCERVVMLDEGKIIYDGKLSKLRSNWGEGKQIEFQFAEMDVTKDKLNSLVQGVEAVWSPGDRKNVWVANVLNSEEVISEVIGRVVASYKITDLKVHEISIEDIIRNIYEEGVIHG
ncbi:ABC-2 type transport system ATP-binding protein [Bacillus ectoiniformans]|uniref:ABC transporter ATP-binding protein n=1 Tax=Bacillus ectoiniformans TaxID=1494429 RepID=UPI0019595FB0|nr:ATP-binding cassette domain-containing protein [Bacillus ectoiniformans]MBM7649766.1 ABC-2 type transport system ATP-binding protein [Bacillus ectoiniformans]